MIEIIATSYITGHVDPGETNEMVTALRETREESGLTENDFNVIDDSEKELNYPVKGKPKRVVYWLAKLINQQANVQLSDEHTEYKWLQLKEACEHVKYDSTVNLLTYYESFINKNNLS